MKIKHLYTRTVVAAAAVWIAGFSPAALWAQEAKRPDPQQIARGAKAWADNCGRCHNLRDAKEIQDYEWDVTILTHAGARQPSRPDGPGHPGVPQGEQRRASPLPLPP